MTSEQQWRLALDAFRAGLEAAREVLADGSEPRGNAWPPATLPTGAPPPALRAEALALLDESDALSKQLMVAMDSNKVPPRRQKTRSDVPHHPRWSVTL